MDYYGARYYDPVVGVFLSADTAQGNMQGMSPYAYVNGNPETHNDPTGRYIGTQISLSQPNGAVGYLMPDHTTITTIINDGAGNVYTVDGRYSHSSSGLSMNTFTNQQEAAYRGNNPNAGTSNTLGGMFQQLGNGILAFLSNFWSNLTTPTGDVTPCGLLSFTPATKVATSQGEKAIGSLHPGERVWAYNPTSHKMELEAILHVWINHDNDLVDLTLTTTTAVQHGKAATKTSETIQTNKKHPFLTQEKGFLTVGQIALGMHVRRADGTYGVVTGWQVVPGTQVMYDLEVAQDHTFTVGVDQWIVHNCGGVDLSIDEARGGHTLAQHVNVTEEDTFLRATVTRGKDASAFYSEGSATQAIQHVIDNVAPRMEGTARVFEGAFTRNIGYVFDRLGNRFETNLLKVVQVPFGSDWRILTAYPLL